MNPHMEISPRCNALFGLIARKDVIILDVYHNPHGLGGKIMLSYL